MSIEIDTSPATDEQAWESSGTVGFMRRLWDIVRGHSAADVSRLREAGIQAVEAEARLKMAEAAKLYAEAERMEAEARQLLERERIDAVADAAERLAIALERIRSQGGEVTFSSEALERLLGPVEEDSVRDHATSPTTSRPAT